MSGADLVWHGTTGPSGTAHNQSQPDTSQWLGDYRASQTVHELQSTLTSAQTAQGRHVLVDSARIGDGVQAHALKWIAMQTGGAAPSAARVVRFDTATGAFVLDRRTEGSLAQIGDTYRLFAPNYVWPAVTAEEAAGGYTSYRAIALLNGHGQLGPPTSVNLRRVIFRDLGSAGAAQWAMVHQTTGAGSAPFMSRSDDETDLFNAAGARVLETGADGFNDTTGWIQLFGTDVDTYPEIGSVSNGLLLNQNCCVWLRRQIPAGTRGRRSVAFQVLFVTDDTSDDPNPLTSSCVIAYDILAGTPAGLVLPDRFAYVGGGSRLAGVVTQQSLPIVDRPVRWAIRLGDQGSIFTDDDPLAGYDVTDAVGAVAATLRSPTPEATAGLMTHPRLVIGAGDEVANPRPRVVLSATASFGFDVAGTATVPDLAALYATPPATGFWPAL